MVWGKVRLQANNKDLINSIVKSIYDSRAPIKDVLPPEVPGLYGVFLSPNLAFDNLCEAGELIYIGKAEDSLARRELKDHFASGKTGKSSLRRSLGAILKSDLGLIAIPRSSKASKKDISCYKFTDSGEELLTNWMVQHLEIGYWKYDISLDIVLGDIEKLVLLRVHAVLDLDPRTVALNKHGKHVKMLRTKCADEARKNRGEI